MHYSHINSCSDSGNNTASMYNLKVHDMQNKVCKWKLHYLLRLSQSLLHSYELQMLCPSMNSGSLSLSRHHFLEHSWVVCCIQNNMGCRHHCHCISLTPIPLTSILWLCILLYYSVRFQRPGMIHKFELSRYCLEPQVLDYRFVTQIGSRYEKRR